MLSLLLHSAPSAMRRRDRDALFSLYETLDGASWYRNVGWAADGDPCMMSARWVGVGCVDPCDRWRDGPDCYAGRVTAIHLEENNMTGNLANWTGVGELTNLTYLDLSLNYQISGTLPTELGQLNNLNSLQLQHNQISGSMPSQLGDINAAGKLDVWYTHNVPITSRLDHILLQHNRLTGSVPSELGVHTRLKDLDVSHNNLTGVLPTQLTNMSSLHTLYVHSNAISGWLPPRVGELVETLHFLDASHNAISGALPPSLGNLRRLNRLNVYANALSGTLPPNLTDMLNVRMLQLQDNVISGSIPDQIGKMQNLRWLDVYNNSMTGDVPASIADLINIENLYLANEHLRPLRQGYCGQRMNPRLGKYSWRLVREEYRNLMSTHCSDDEVLSTEYTFNSLPDQDWEY